MDDYVMGYFKMSPCSIVRYSMTNETQPPEPDEGKNTINFDVICRDCHL